MSLLSVSFPDHVLEAHPQKDAVPVFWAPQDLVKMEAAWVSDGLQGAGPAQVWGQKESGGGPYPDVGLHFVHWFWRLKGTTNFGVWLLTLILRWF